MYRVLLIIIFLLPFSGFAQVKTIGTPNILNYPKSVYKAGTQNWDIAQDADGFMYFANNDGLLCFDGLHWNLSKVSDSSPVRSVLVSDKNVIYVGLINDFGIFTQNEPELPVFKSLKHLLPPDIKEFDDIWRIHETSQGIVFQCYKYLFIYKDEKIEVLKPQNNFHFSFQLDDKLYIQELGIGLFELDDGVLSQLPVSNKLIDKNISTILKINNNKTLIGTEANGLFVFDNDKIEKWDTPVNAFLEQNKLYSATTISDNYFVFGTILNGLVIADSEGTIVQVLNSTNGIQNNTILSSFADRDGNLWLGLDNGIDYVELNSPISFISKSTDIGTGYCCAVFKQHIYLGTNQGLFVRPFTTQYESRPFELVKNTAGQVWSLAEFDGQLICGHNRGTFVINGNKARKISDVAGAWKYIRLKNNPNYLLGGHFNGLVLLKKGTNGWEFDRKIEGFEESSRYIEQSSDGDIWISHGNRGVFKIVFEGLDNIVAVEHYTLESGLPSTTNNILFEFKNELYVSTINKVYKYQPETNGFIQAREVSKLLNINGRIKVFEEDAAGNIWFISDNETGVLRYNEDLTYTKITTPFKKLSDSFVNEFEFIYPYNNENIFIGTVEGFAHYDAEFTKPYSQSFSSFIIKVEVPYIDSIFYFNNVDTKLSVELPYRKNAIRFNFAAPFYENESLLFSYFLEGFSEEWSHWSGDSYKEFTNLKEGEYVFKLKAKNIFEVESEMATVTFTISPPWHRSKMAYILYSVLFLLITFLFIKFILYRIKRAKQKEGERYKQKIKEHKELSMHQALIAEKEIIKLRNDKLRTEKIHRDKELANQTMGLIQKNKLLVTIIEELQYIHNLIKNDSAKSKIYSLKKRIKKEVDNKQQNKIFQTYFDEVHHEFFNRLNEKYPILTPNDLRLCAYIKMNISTKEIATILNISYRGAEIRRYRLRKKLELSREVNLSTFLLNI